MFHFMRILFNCNSLCVNFVISIFNFQYFSAKIKAYRNFHKNTVFFYSKQILNRIIDTERLIADLRRAAFNNGIPLRVAQQRLQIRKARPQPNENCSDPPQHG
jgi:Tektin family